MQSCSGQPKGAYAGNSQIPASACYGARQFASAALPNLLMSKPLTLIVACAENRVIGRDGRLPFDIPEDKAWFHEKTAGQTVVLGRICFETWPKVLADGRQPVVITSQPKRILSTKVAPALRACSRQRFRRTSLFPQLCVR